MSTAIELHSHEAGRGRPSILLLHGLNESLAGYRPIMEALSPDYHLLAVDLRGHGKSAWRKPYRIQDYADDILQFLELRSIRHVILAGHSLGGLVAAYLAGRKPGLVRGLFLEEPPFFTVQMPALKETDFYGVLVFVRELIRQHHAADGTIDSMELIVSQLTTDAPDGEVIALTSLYDEEYLSRLAMELHQTDPGTLDAVLDGTLFGRFSPDRDLPIIDCPSHLIAGQFDYGGAMKPDDVTRVLDLIPDCTHHVWDEIGHDLHHLRPEKYGQELHHFVSSLKE